MKRASTLALLGAVLVLAGCNQRVEEQRSAEITAADTEANAEGMADTAIDMTEADAGTPDGAAEDASAAAEYAADGAEDYSIECPGDPRCD